MTSSNIRHLMKLQVWAGSVHECMEVCVYELVYGSMCVYMSVWKYVCMNVCKYVCMDA